MIRQTTVVSSVTSLVILTICLFIAAKHRNTAQPLSLETPYGPLCIEDPCLEEIIKDPAIERLKGVHQYGILRYATPTEPYSRYEHSIGVLKLLKKYNCSKEEQLAGLLQDVSHTAFSHLANYVFEINTDSHAYHEGIHLWFLQQTNIAEILKKYGFSLHQLHPKKGNFIALEQPLPALSANRIEYNLQGAFRRGMISQEQINTILSHLHYSKPHWYFTDQESARKIALISLHLTEHLWGSASTLLFCHWTSEIVRHAIKQKYITKKQFLFSQDHDLWDLLVKIDDPYIKERLNSVRSFEQRYRTVPPEKSELHLRGKFRGLDPLVLTEKGIHRLTEIDLEYKKEYNKVKKLMKNGWHIALIEEGKFFSIEKS